MKVEELVKEIRSLSRPDFEKLVEECYELFLEFYTVQCYPEPYCQYDEYGNQIYVEPKLFTVTLSAVSQNVPTLKILRSWKPDLSLQEARYIIEHLPYVLGNNVRENVAYDAKEQLEAVGAVVTLKEEDE